MLKNGFYANEEADGVEKILLLLFGFQLNHLGHLDRHAELHLFRTSMLWGSAGYVETDSGRQALHDGEPINGKDRTPSEDLNQYTALNEYNHLILVEAKMQSGSAITSQATLCRQLTLIWLRLFICQMLCKSSFDLDPYIKLT